MKFEPSVANDDPRTGRFFCMIDSDGENKLDRFFPVYAQRKDEKLPQPMPPIAISITPQMLFVPPREIAIVFSGRGGLAGVLVFYAAMKVGDTLQPLDFPPANVLPSSLPKSLSVAGAKFVVESYEPTGRTVKVRVETPILPYQLIRPRPELGIPY